MNKAQQSVMLTSQLKIGLAIISVLLSSSSSSISPVSLSSYNLQMRSNGHLRFGTAGPTAAENEGEVEGPFGNSVNAVPFCLMATAVLISIFLLLAIFERFMSIRQTQSPPLDSKHPPFAPPKIDVCKGEISVVMPGEEVPTFIAQPCPPLSSRNHLQFYD